MNTVCEKNMCVGCMACSDSCPVSAITVVDDLDSYNAIIDASKCINCNLCKKVCLNNNPPVFRSPILWKQGWSDNSSIRNNSSSGGIATAIEKAFVEKGGIVYSCIYLQGEFVFVRADNVNDIYRFTGSKYVKSNPKGIYGQIKRDLKNGYKVLFVGLPCQVAAVAQFCENAFNLFTIDLICHGTPSPKLLENYIIEKGLKLEDINNIGFRSKTKFHLKINGTPISVPRIVDYYTMLFMNGTIYTKNCYSCNFAKVDRVSDMCLGDSWGSSLSDEEKKKGISLILVQTEKGKELLDKCGAILYDVDIKNAISYNRQLSQPSTENPMRSKFFYSFKQNRSCRKATLQCFPKQFVKDEIKRILVNLKILK